MFKSILYEILPKITHTTVKTINYNVNNQIKRKFSNILQNKTNFIQQQQQQRYFSVTSSKCSLLEFFDDEKNWGETFIKHGREWKLDELRLKSSVDLHKLWFVLLKERNMLLTMEEAYKKEQESFPNPERIAKIDLSMENLLRVVRERNVSYNLLETGETNEKTSYYRFNSIGLLQKHQPREYYLPWFLNKKWKLKYHYQRLPFWSKWYRNQLAVRENKQRRKQLRKIKTHIDRLNKLYPDLAGNHAEFWEEYYKVKENLDTTPRTYSSKLNKPKPGTLPGLFREKPKPKIDVVEEQL